jgi:hypothetical protein
MHIKNPPLKDLRSKWSRAWGMSPHERIGRIMLEESLNFKLNNRLTTEQKKHLKQLTKRYKNNPRCFDKKTNSLKPGTRLSKIHNGQEHTVVVKEDGYDYDGKLYKSLSRIANVITGKKWNGWVFFGLKKVSKP